MFEYFWQHTRDICRGEEEEEEEEEEEVEGEEEDEEEEKSTTTTTGDSGYTAVIPWQHWPRQNVDLVTELRIGMNVLTSRFKVANPREYDLEYKNPKYNERGMYACPLGANSLRDYTLDRPLDNDKPFTKNGWSWFARQLTGLVEVGVRYEIPPAIDFQNQWLETLEQAYIGDFRSSWEAGDLDFPFGSRAFFEAIHRLITAANPDLVGDQELPQLWSKNWFELLVDVLRIGWAWEGFRKWTRKVEWHFRWRVAFMTREYRLLNNVNKIHILENHTGDFPINENTGEPEDHLPGTFTIPVHSYLTDVSPESWIAGECTPNMRYEMIRGQPLTDDADIPYGYLAYDYLLSTNDGGGIPSGVCGGIQGVTPLCAIPICGTYRPYRYRIVRRNGVVRENSSISSMCYNPCAYPGIGWLNREDIIINVGLPWPDGLTTYKSVEDDDPELSAKPGPCRDGLDYWSPPSP